MLVFSYILPTKRVGKHARSMGEKKKCHMAAINGLDLGEPPPLLDDGTCRELDGVTHAWTNLGLCESNYNHNEKMIQDVNRMTNPPTYV
jgi:hypothetical protein